MVSAPPCASVAYAMCSSTSSASKRLTCRTPSRLSPWMRGPTSEASRVSAAGGALRSGTTFSCPRTLSIGHSRSRSPTPASGRTMPRTSRSPTSSGTWSIARRLHLASTSYGTAGTNWVASACWRRLGRPTASLTRCSACRTFMGPSTTSAAFGSSLLPLKHGGRSRHSWRRAGSAPSKAVRLPPNWATAGASVGLSRRMCATRSSRAQARARWCTASP
mmetsp:Transcript_122442/g.305693  ORF Transcript_122442/g.305693 Transcript_122442/m.305693 type:complete len:219 (-) Transcript_122442:1188-1844(-)